MCSLNYKNKNKMQQFSISWSMLLNQQDTRSTADDTNQAK